MERVLVTGHTGFIGSHMFSFLENVEGVKPIGYSRSTGQNVFDSKTVENYVKKSDLVYHFAAYAKPGESINKPNKAIGENINGVLTLLNSCKKHSVPMVYPSSCEIYGNSREPITEEFPLNPPNPYAASKAAADRVCYSFFKSYDLDVKIVRLFNPYGPEQQLNKIIPVFFSQARKEKPLTVYGDGSDTRDYVFIDDIIRGLWSARNLHKGEAINLATGKETSNLEMAKLILELTDSSSEISFTSYPEEFGGIKNQVGANEKAKESIGWEPEVTLREGVKDTIEWLKGVGKSGERE